MKSKFILIALFSVYIFACKKAEKAEEQANLDTRVTYKNAVEGIIKKYCNNCHSPERTYMYSNAGDLNTYTELVKRVESGTLKDKVLVSRTMPLAGFPKLSAEEEEQLTKWLDNQYPLE